MRPLSPRLPGLPLSPLSGGGEEGARASKGFPFRSAREGDPRPGPRASASCSSGDAAPREARRRRAQGGLPSLPPRRERGVGGDGSWDDARTGVLPGVPGAQGAFEDWMARWFPRFASRIAFRCVLHPRESRDIRRRELFRGFVSRGHARRGPQSASEGGGGAEAPPSPLRLSVARSVSRKTWRGGCAVGGYRDGPPSSSEEEKREAPTLRIGVARRLPKPRKKGRPSFRGKPSASMVYRVFVSMILPQVHLRKPCYDFSFL